MRCSGELMFVWNSRQVSGTSLSDPTPWGGGTFGEVLLAPTIIYVRRLLSLIEAVDVKVWPPARCPVPPAREPLLAGACPQRPCLLPIAPCMLGSLMLGSCCGGASLVDGLFAPLWAT
jgi:hypothetical protein